LGGHRRNAINRCLVPLAVLALSACGGGGSGAPAPSAAMVTISGTVSYQHVPPRTTPSVCDGLDFANVQVRPIRGATIQVIRSSSGAVLASAVTPDTGAYSFTIPAQTNAFLRVRAELKQAGTPSWDVEVRDNVVNPTVPNPPPLNLRPIYALDSSEFNSGGADSTRNLTATTGWGANSYTGVRAAAPFAILDTIYTVMNFIAAADSGRSFPPLDVYWSINNNTSSGSGDFLTDIDNGDIGTSFYTGGSLAGLFLLGMDGDDTEEFDDHVIAHEWAHYFEDNFSRSDSIGGPHGLGDLLDVRLAFSEGFATAMSGITLNDPNYCDTLWSQGALRGFRIDIENGNSGPNPGWYNEYSILKLVYDLWDDGVNEAADLDSIGFAPIYDVMIGPQADTPAFTSVFTFGEALKNQGTGKNVFIDAQLTREDIQALNIDSFGSTETNDAGAAQDVLPIYTDIIADGSSVPICSNSQFDRIGASLAATGNKLSEHRFLRMVAPASGQYTFTILTDAATVAQLPPDDPDNPFDQSDPDIEIYHFGFLAGSGISGDANAEIFAADLPAAGEYVMDFHEFRYDDTNTLAGFPERACFTIQVTGP
jgi:hypothetical protein